MIYVLVISIITCSAMITVTLIKPKLTVGGVSVGTYWLITLIGATALIAFRLIGIREVFEGLTADTAVNPLKILLLFISMTVLSIFLDETGFFKYLANIVLNKCGSSQIKLFTAFYITVSVLTVFTSNDIIILAFTPFICYFAKNAKIDPIPYLISEFVAANTCSMLLIIGNPTNIYLATAQGISFFSYLKVMALPALFAAFTAYFVMLALFYKKLKKPLTGRGEKVEITQKPLLIIGLVCLLTATVLLCGSAYIKIQMHLIAAFAAAGLIVAVTVISLIRRRKPIELLRSLKRAPYELVPFVISMFVIVLALEKYKVTETLATVFGQSNGIIIYGTASTLFANLINNIPMSVLFSSILQSLNPAVAASAAYAAIIGSNIGAFLTPIGALAGIMWLEILKNNGITLSFSKFLLYGTLIAVPVLFAALGGLAISCEW